MGKDREESLLGVMLPFPQTCYADNETVHSFNELVMREDPCLVNMSRHEWNINDTDLVSTLLQDYKRSLYLLLEPRTIILMCLYAIVFILSVIGNSLVITIIQSQKGQRSSTSLFLLVMALADLVVAIICIPATMAQSVYRGWLLGEVTCKIAPYAQGVALSSSIYTVVLMSLDRFLSIRHSALLKRLNTTSYTKICVTFIWILSGLFMVPILAVRTTDHVEILSAEPVYFCTEGWSSSHKRLSFSLAVLVGVYIVPCMVMGSLYTVLGKALWSSQEDRMMQRRESTVSVASCRAVIGRRRVARTSIIILAVFMLCWLPSHIFNMVVEISYRLTDSTILYGFHFALWIGHANCAIKPVLYCFMGTTFRRKMIRLIMKCSPVCKQQVFTVAYQMDPTNFQWTLADYGLAAGASPRPSFASWNTSLPSPISCYSLHWPMSDHTPRASISTQSRSYQHSPRSSVGFLSPGDDYSPRGSFCTDARGEPIPATMCFLDTPPFLSPRTSVSIDRRGSSVSQQRTPRPSISVEPPPRGRQPKISVSFEDHDIPPQSPILRTSPRGSFCIDDHPNMRSPHPVYMDERPIIRSPRQSFCSEEPVFITTSPRPSFCTDERQMFLRTKPYLYHQEERRSSRRSPVYAETNPRLLSPMYCTNERQSMRRHSVTTSTDYQNTSRSPTRQKSYRVDPPTMNVTSTDQSDVFTDVDHEQKNPMHFSLDRPNEDSEETVDLSPGEMITYTNSRRHSLASNASRSNKASSPRSEKSDQKNRRQLKRQHTTGEQNRSRRSSVATIADSIENASRRDSVITLAELKENRSRRNSTNTLGDNLETRSRRSSVITLGDAWENMMRVGSRNTLAESTSNRSQKSSPHSRSPSQRGSPHSHTELEAMRARPPPTVSTVRRSSIAAMGDSLDSTGTIKEKRRASCSDFSETTYDSDRRLTSALHQQHSFPFGKHEETHRRPSHSAIEMVDQFLLAKPPQAMLSDVLANSGETHSGTKSRSRSPSPNVRRKDSIPIQRTSPRASPKDIPDEESDDEHFRPISDISDSTSRIIEWKKSLERERINSEDLESKDIRKKARSPTTEKQRNGSKDKRNGQDKQRRPSKQLNDLGKSKDNSKYEATKHHNLPRTPEKVAPLPKINPRRASHSESDRSFRQSPHYAETAFHNVPNKGMEHNQGINSEEESMKARDQFHAAYKPQQYYYEDHIRQNPPEQMQYVNPRTHRRASVHTDSRRYSPQPCYVLREDPEYDMEPMVYYRSRDVYGVEHVYQEPQRSAFAENQGPEMIPEHDAQHPRGRRHSYVGIPHCENTNRRQPSFFIGRPSQNSTKRRSSVSFVRGPETEEMVQLLQDHNRPHPNHPALRQKRASLPVVETLPALYYTNPYDNRGPRTVHIAYPQSAPIPLVKNSRKQKTKQKHHNIEEEEGEASFNEQRERTRSRSVSWQCDEVDEEDEDSEVTSSLLKSNYMEIAT